MKKYNKENVPLARKLRANMTPWERKLWYEYLRYYPVRFQRQKTIGAYIVDFYCAKAGIVVELDGGGHYHEEQIQKDNERTEALSKMKLRVLRICNMDIDKNFRGVCEYIDREVQKSLPQSASLTAPSSEGAMDGGSKIIALGFFDGVHLGHQALLRECVRLALKSGAIPAAITFDRHPQAYFTENPPKLLFSTQDRCRMLQQYGMEQVFTYPVNEEVMSTLWEEFLEMLLCEGAAGFVCGHDFRFGYKGEGNSEKLQEFCAQRGIPCVIVPEQDLEGIRISSTHIRGLVEGGNVELAAKFLGHPHILTGKVVEGRRLGRTIGVPTANILIPEDVVVPQLGVYAGKCILDGKEYVTVTNIGSRPTVGGHQVRAESWILDFEGDLYGREITLEFHKFLRPEQKFESLEDLKAQIQRDAEKAQREM